jgi:DNA-3-methyladenine glycosylase
MARVGRDPSLSRLLDGLVQFSAPGLLGCLLDAGAVTVRLTEVEAYDGVGLDAASHAHRGQTPRNAIMFGRPGMSYVYFTYGMHWCLNVVCREEGTASAVLLRAGSIVDGLDIARARRPGAKARDLLRGPARLTQALGITGAHNGVDLLSPDSWVRLRPPPTGTAPGPADIRRGPRVGVVGEADRPWRFWIAGDESVSTYRAATPRSQR